MVQMTPLHRKSKSVHFMSESHEWATPQAVFDALNKEFHFTLDPCSTHENAKCKKHYTIEDDGLKKDWYGETLFPLLVVEVAKRCVSGVGKTI